MATAGSRADAGAGNRPVVSNHIAKPQNAASYIPSRRDLRVSSDCPTLPRSVKLPSITCEIPPPGVRCLHPAI